MPKKQKVIEGEITESPPEESAVVLAEPETGIVSLTSAMSSKDLKSAVKLMTDQRKIIADFIKENLVDGVDYGVIESTSKSGKTFKSKPTLYKPGMEKILSLFGLASELTKDVETLEMLSNAHNVIAYKCIITRNNQKIAEGRGAATVGDMSRDINSTIKIAEKRARMDACLSLGFSEYFTQDMDDPEYRNGGSNFNKPKPAYGGYNQPAAPKQLTGPMTDNQRKMIFGLLVKLGHSEREEQIAIVTLNTGTKEGEQVSAQQASGLIGKLQNKTYARPKTKDPEDIDPPSKGTDVVVDPDSVDMATLLDDVPEATVIATEEAREDITDKVNSLGLPQIGLMRFLKDTIGKPILKNLSDSEWMQLDQKVDAILDGKVDLSDEYRSENKDSKTNANNVSEGQEDGTNNTKDN